MRVVNYPATWIKRKLSEVITPRGEKVSPAICPGLKFLGMNHVEAHSTRIIGFAPAEKMKSSAARFYKNDVLYGRLRPYLNKVARPSFDGLASAEFIVFPETDLLSSAFLKHRLNAIDFVSFASHLNDGDRPRVSFDQIGDFELLVPPKNEQHRIVAKIEGLFSELDEGIARLKTARVQLAVYRQALLKHAFEGKLTEQWRKENADKLEPAETLLARIKQKREARYEQQLKKWKASGKQGSKPKAPKSISPLTATELAELSKLPEEWRWVRVGEIADVQLGRQRSPKNRSNNFPTKYIRAGNLTDDGLSLEDVLDMEFKPEERARFLLKVGDVLLSEASGSAKQVGKPAIWRGEIEECCFQNTVIRVRSLPELSEYLFWVFKTCYVSGAFSRLAGGVGINHLSAGKLTSMPIPLVAIFESGKILKIITEQLSSIENLDRSITNSLQQSEALRQSILKKAFSGQLVPQDPDDEPASVLLERIKAEKAKQAAKVKPRINKKFSRRKK